MEKLKPCPFCGSKARVGYAINDYNRWGVTCNDCGCTVDVEEWKGIADTLEGSIAAWNKRVNDIPNYRLTVEEIDFIMRRVNCLKGMIFKNGSTMDMCNSISDKLEKQKEMLEEWYE